jgi:hypothetical protein
MKPEHTRIILNTSFGNKEKSNLDNLIKLLDTAKYSIVGPQSSDSLGRRVACYDGSISKETLDILKREGITVRDLDDAVEKQPYLIQKRDEGYSFNVAAMLLEALEFGGRERSRTA